MSRLLRLAVLCLALAALGFAGCGDSDDSGGGGGGDTQAETPEQTQPETQAQTETSGGTPAAGEVTVDMKDIKYVPQTIAAKVGQTIKWTNSDPVAHTVTADDESFNSGTINAGDTYERKFDQAGAIPYFCEIHPNQKGTINVTE